MTRSAGNEILKALRLIGPLRRQMARLLPDEVGPGGLVALRVVHTVEGARVSDVAASQHVGLPVASRQVRHLEDQGLLTREVCADDRRAHRLSLTPAGLELLERVESELTAAIDTVLDHWPAEDAVALARLMTRLHEDISSLPDHSSTDHQRTENSDRTLQETAV